MTRSIRPAALLWGLAGLAGAVMVMVMAGTGLAILPLFVPLVVFVTVLVEARAPYPWAAAVGVGLAVDLFAIGLVLSPPCVAPVLTNLGDGTFELSCAEHENLMPVAAAVLVGTILVGGLVYALASGRFTRTVVPNYDRADVADTDQ